MTAFTKHSGFDVYVGEPIAVGDRETLGHVARYLLRPPISLERLWYDPEAEKVTLRPLAAEKAEPVELEPLEFIARLVQHIPDVRERQVLYYGVYANASKRLPRCMSRDIQFHDVRGRPVLRPPPTIVRLSFASLLFQLAFSTRSRSRSL
jgi:hypothetical protein